MNSTETAMNELAAAKIIKLATTLMKNVKLNCKFTSEVFTVTFNEKQEKTDKKVEAIEITSEPFDCSELPAPVYVSCAASQHGIKQKMADSLALTAELKETTTVKDAINTLTELWLQLKGNADNNIDGSWNATSRSAKTPVVTLSSFETMLLSNVASGMISYEAANAMFKGQTGKELSK